MKSLVEDIKKFSWYQTVDFEPGISSNGCAWCGDPVWPLIHEFTGNLSGKRVLDLGSNAGIFCVRAALDGASECVGIESDSWKPDDHYSQQANFVKSYFESREGKTLPISYINGHMEELVNNNLGHFDWCFAIASLYYASDIKHVIEQLYQISNNVLLRLRDKSKIDFICSLMTEAGFSLRASLKEDWSHLNSQADEFYLFHYAH